MGKNMAMIFKNYRPRIASMMLTAACEDDDKNLKQWLYRATFAKTSNRYWLAWHNDKPDTVLVLPPDDNQDKECHWVESWDKDDTIETAIEYVESGQFAEDDLSTLNLFIEDPETGEWR
jgi:hypothetical protein